MRERAEDTKLRERMHAVRKSDLLIRLASSLFLSWTRVCAIYAFLREALEKKGWITYCSRVKELKAS